MAQWQFALTCGRTKYATTLEGLARPVPQTGHAFLSPDLGQPNGFEHSGYRIQMAAKPIDGANPACNGAPVADGYEALQKQLDKLAKDVEALTKEVRDGRRPAKPTPTVGGKTSRAVKTVVRDKSNRKVKSVGADGKAT